MRFTRIQMGVQSKYQSYLQGKKNNFVFQIREVYKHEKGKSVQKFFVFASHSKLDITYNSLTEDKYFLEESKAIEFCENFNYADFRCFGNDVEDDNDDDW